MRKRYGLPYKGSKNAIAREIVDFLPSSEVLVDICAGGCAVTHAALESGKWERVVANDVNEGIVRLFLDAVEGKYRGEKRWVSREDFYAQKDNDPWIKWCWSFGNNGEDYMYAKEIEAYKKALHEMLFAETVNERRVKYRAVLAELNKYLIAVGKYPGGDVSLTSLQSLQSLESLERLQSLESLESLQSLEISSKDYAEVEIPRGAVVYADIPYEGTDCKGYGNFDHARFYEWAAAQNEAVYVSSYEIADTRFTEVWCRKKTVLSGSKGTEKHAIEKIYANEAGVRALGILWGGA